MTSDSSYVEARESLRAELADEWNDGTFCLDDRVIVQNDDLFVFKVGPRELLVDGDLRYARFGGAVPAVHKRDGRLMWIPEVRLLEMAPSLRTQRNPTPTLDV